MKTNRFNIGFVALVVAFIFAILNENTYINVVIIALGSVFTLCMGAFAFDNPNKTEKKVIDRLNRWYYNLF